ncbi:MAG: class I SAM-dependent DNA methyltransferase, partial [Flavobacteriales bacterium]|nr:class I SAM-dependent DNA methyltransferase [Flavobacteriales bacterium]
VARLPLKKAAKIVHGNSLRIDWETVVPKTELSYIVGNPPFYGKSLQTKEQKEDMKLVFGRVQGAGVLDYVAAWYYKAAQYLVSTNIKTGFVSTNSITQGEQTGILWNELLNNYKIKIHFAHTTFNWTNEAKGKAAVHCVIVGFANYDTKEKYLFEYDDIKGEPQVRKVK